ncbi:MAG TPA: antitoxin [Archaeoglobaceae archaeon]|nr:antitoxin [Archaeoglobaceae archaeon]
MVKTITIRDDVYSKLLAIKGEESFSELIERLIESRGVEILKKIRNKTEFSEEEKKIMLREIYAKKEERRDFADSP